MEYEVRFYLAEEKTKKIIEKLDSINILKKSLRTYEKTMQYNHPDSRYDFYSKEIDGRFRIRISINDDDKKCLISWKKRLKDTHDGLINKEEEKELNIKYEEYTNLEFIIDNVLHFKLIESYERYRTTYFNEEVEIAIDEYPFGCAIEIENKSDDDPYTIIKKYVDMIDLDLSQNYRLSWDDRYTELCRKQNIKILNEVHFGSVMPKL